MPCRACKSEHICSDRMHEERGVDEDHKGMITGP